MNGFRVVRESTQGLLPDIIAIGDETEESAILRSFFEAYHASQEQRVALRLLALGEPEGEWSMVNQFVVCASAGVSRPSANAVLVKFREDGLIDMGRGKFMIVDAAGLVERALSWTA